MIVWMCHNSFDDYYDYNALRDVYFDDNDDGNYSSDYYMLITIWR